MGPQRYIFGLDWDPHIQSKRYATLDISLVEIVFQTRGAKKIAKKTVKIFLLLRVPAVPVFCSPVSAFLDPTIIGPVLNNSPAFLKSHSYFYA